MNLKYAFVKFCELAVKVIVLEGLGVVPSAAYTIAYEDAERLAVFAEAPAPGAAATPAIPAVALVGW